MTKFEIYNINAIRNAMDSPVKSNRMHLFFDGATSRLDIEELKEVIKIIDEGYKEMAEYLNDNLEEKEKELIQIDKNDI